MNTIKKINVLTREHVSSESQVLSDHLQKRVGKFPNLYAAIGYSSHALKQFLDSEETLAKGVLTSKEREAIALVVSEINACLAGHAALAIKRGFTKEDTWGIRRGHTDDVKLNALVELAKSIVENRGKPDHSLLAAFYHAGFKEDALMELIGLITLRIFTNNAFSVTEVPIDFQLADPLPKEK